MISGYAMVAGVVACGKADSTDKKARRMAPISPAPFSQELSARSFSDARRAALRGNRPAQQRGFLLDRVNGNGACWRASVFLAAQVR